MEKLTDKRKEMMADKSPNRTHNLTDKHFWDQGYATRSTVAPFDDKDWKNYGGIQLVRKLSSLELDGRRILEIGGGDAELLCYLARKHPSARCAVVDFSPLGCQRARERAKHEQVNLDIFQVDMFSPPDDLKEAFDIVISLGVVEHFPDLPMALSAKKSFAKVGGTLFTVIPNLSSPIYRYLCRRWSQRVLGMHVLHDMDSFIKGHKEAGLKVVETGYLGSIEFGMLSISICDMPETRRFDRFFYLWLTRFSKAVHLFEYNVLDLPGTKLFSPFMYVLSRDRD